MNVFMYATQSRLIEQESQIFYDLGCNVYTAAWATGKTTHYIDKFDYAPEHFFHGKSSFLSDADIEVFSKIGVDLNTSNNTYDSHFDPKIQELLLDKFDALYVSEPTTWLVYAKQMLDAGKKVIFRTFGYPTQSWGPFNITGLYEYPNFYVCPCTPYESGLHGGKKLNFIMTGMVRKLYRKLISEGPPYVFTIFPGFNPAIEAPIRIKLEGSAFAWKVHDYCKVWLPNDEIFSLFTNCRVFLDVNSMVRYPAIEAMLYDVPSLVQKDTNMEKFLVDCGLSSEPKWVYENIDDLYSLLDLCYNNEETRESILNSQKTWVDNTLEANINKWKEILGV